MCAVNLKSLDMKGELGASASQTINEVQSDIKEGITSVQKEALSLFGKVKEKVTKNLSALKGLFITGSMVTGIVAAVKGLAAVGLAALGPAGWAVIGGAFLIGLAISAYEAHGKGKNIFKGMMSDICTYTALCVLSLLNKMISEKKSIPDAFVALKDDLLGNAEKDLDKVKNDIDACFNETKNNIIKISDKTLKRLEDKKTLLEAMFESAEEKLEQQKVKNREEDKEKLEELENALKQLKQDKLEEFSAFIETLKGETKDIQGIFDHFLNDIQKEQKANGATIKTDVKKLVEDFQNKTSEINKHFGNIITEASRFLSNEILSPQKIEAMIRSGGIKLLEYGSSEIANKCFEIDESFSGNNAVKDILKSVSENVKNKSFEDLEQKFKELTSLAKEKGKNAAERQIEALKALCDTAKSKYEEELTAGVLENKVQSFFNKLFGINEAHGNNNPQPA